MLLLNCYNNLVGFVILLTISNVHSLLQNDEFEETALDEYTKTSFESYLLMDPQLIIGNTLKYCQDIIKGLKKFLNALLRFHRATIGLKNNIYLYHSIIDPKIIESLLIIKIDALNLWSKGLDVTRLINNDLNSWINILLNIPGFKQVHKILKKISDFIYRLLKSNFIDSKETPTLLSEFIQTEFKKIKLLSSNPIKTSILAKSGDQKK